MAMASVTVHRCTMHSTPANLYIIASIGDRVQTEVVALPIMHGDRTIGILYGDNAEHRAPIDDVTGLEIFLSQAGSAFENAAAQGNNETNRYRRHPELGNDTARRGSGDEPVPAVAPSVSEGSGGVGTRQRRFERRPPAQAPR